MRGLLALLALLVSPVLWAAHGYAMYDQPKYPAGFTQFDYVDTSIKVGGAFIWVPPIRVTRYDKYNPFTLKGTAAPGYDLLFESLLIGSLDDPTSGYALLAEDVEVPPDRLSATFRLNPKARFQDGTPVLAADVKHSFDQLTGKLASPQYRSLYAEVSKVEVLGERSIRFSFKQANLELPLLVGGMPVFSRAWGKGKPFDQIITDPPVVSGPYKLGNHPFGQDTTYQRDPNYWGWSLPVRRGTYNFERVVYKLYTDETARFEAFKAGEFDFIEEFVSRNWARQYKGRQFNSGELVKREFEHRNPGDFQGYVLNLRNPKLKDIRVRQALSYLLDFEWANRQLFYNSYKRVHSYFPVSDFEATGTPGADELALLEPWRAKLAPEVFGQVPLSPSTAPPDSLRSNLKKALALMEAAGWKLKDGLLRNAKGEPFTLEYLTDQPSTVRVFTPMQQAGEKIGIQLKPKIVDYALSKKRLDEFDFELKSLRMLGNHSPGSELVELLGSDAAKTPGSNNYWGIQSPVVDALVQKATQARSRKDLVAALRALDRVLRHGYYSIGQWTSSAHRIGYRAPRFVLPAKLPPYYKAGEWAIACWGASAANMAGENR